MKYQVPKLISKNKIFIFFIFAGNLLTSRHGDDRRIDKQISYSTNVIVSTLTIRNSKMSDTGTYVCRTSELLTDRFKVDVLNGTWFTSYLAYVFK